MSAAGIALTSLAGCFFVDDSDEPFAYEEVVIPTAVAEPGTRFEYLETALVPLEDGRHVALTLTQLMVGGPGNWGLAEIGSEWTQPESMNFTIGVQGDATEGTSALPPDLVGILDDGSVALRATEDEAPETIDCDSAFNLPDQDEADSRQLRCMMYLIPHGRTLVEVQWGSADGDPAYAENPIAWRVPSLDEMMSGALEPWPTPTS